MLPYHFHPLTANHLPLIKRWLHTPEVIRWWGQPDEQFDLIAEDLAEPGMRQWIVHYHQVPFAYAQAYRISQWPQAHFAPFNQESIGIDMFIGEPTMLGVGHGAGFIRALSDTLLAEGAPAVVIDPDVHNIRAQRAYLNAGFTSLGEAPTAEGDRIVLMHRTV